MRTEQAAPCADRTCRTTGGFVPVGARRPQRRRGLCHRCYDFHQRHGTLDQFPRHSGPRKLVPTWLVRQQREALIADRVARHEAGGLTRAMPLTEGEDNTTTRVQNAERFAAAYLAAAAAA